MVALAALFQQITSAYEFEFISETPLNSVAVAGTFNSWNKAADPLKPSANRKIWKLSKQITFGEHQYKFVLNDETWIPDPNAKSIIDAGGNKNSILNIVPSDYKSPAALADGIIATSLLAEFKPPTVDENEIRFTFNTRPNDVEKVQVVINGSPVQMKRVAGDFLTSTYCANAPFQDFSYDYLVTDGNKSITIPGGKIEINKQPKIKIPDWPKSQVFYQIFPDRFQNGDLSNDPPNTQSWDSQPTYTNFLGGDLQGVQSKIPYLKELGITGIYFNPIFDGPSNHGYQTSDYKLIDKNLGSNQQFINLSKSLNQNQIKVVLDGVFNHTSTEFAPFKDLLTNQRSSQYKDWFFVKSFPIQPNTATYEGWAGFSDLPKLNVLNPQAQKFILDSVDFWQDQAHIDGWRLDVANEVAPEFWRIFRRHLKAENESTWIMGENWTDSSQWLQGDQWDSTMNYPVRNALLNFFANQSTTASEFTDELFHAYLLYPKSISDNTLTFLSTHDTPRILTLCQNDQARANLAAITLFAWPGIPSVYYGDELGMKGGPDPDNRRGMEWQNANQNNSTLSLYKKLVNARVHHPALQSGIPEIIATNNQEKTVVFSRVKDNDLAIIVLNNSNSSQVIKFNLPPHLAKLANGKTFTDAISKKQITVSQSGQLVWSSPRHSGAILLPRSNSINLSNQSLDSGKLQ